MRVGQGVDFRQQEDSQSAIFENKGGWSVYCVGFD